MLQGETLMGLLSFLVKEVNLQLTKAKGYFSRAGSMNNRQKHERKADQHANLDVKRV